MKLLQDAARRALSLVSRRSASIATLVGIIASLPTFAHAGEGDNVRLKFEGENQALLLVALALGVVSIIYGLFLANGVKREPAGDDKMQEVGKAIRDGAVAYLRQQIRTMILFVVLLALGLIGVYYSYGIGTAIGVAVSFVAGVAGSYIAGSTGMIIAVNGNMRTANAALSSYRKALEVAFRSGAVAGLMTVGIGLVGSTLILLIGGDGAIKFLIGFGFGGSLAALFMRVGGGIFTKAADVGADLVGKVEAGIPEDDPRNPATIADNVGDNVGDCAGMAADVFESYIVLLISAIVLGAATSAVLDTVHWMKLVVFAMVVAGIGALASVVGIAIVRGKDDLESDPLVPIRRGFLTTAGLAALLTFAAGYLVLGKTSMSSSLLQSTRDEFRSDHRFFTDLRNKVALKKPSEAAVLKAQDQTGKAINKAAAQVTAADIFQNPTEIPDDLQGFSQASVDRVISKSTDSVEPFEVTAVDLALTKEAADRGFSVDEVARINELITATRTQLSQEDKMEGFTEVSDVPTSKLPALDYAMNSRSSDPTVSTQEPYTTVRKVFSGTGSDQLVLAQVRIKADIPAQPGQDGAPGLPARKIDRKFTQGPVAKKDLEKQISEIKAQAAQQKVDAQIDVLATYPVNLFYNSESDDFAIGVAKQVKQPYQFEASLTPFGYYKRSAKVLNDTFKAAQANNKMPSMPPITTMQVGVAVSAPLPWYLFPGAVVIGIILAFAIERLTEYYVSTHKRPTQEVAGVSSGGAAPMLIQGFAFASESSAMMVFAIVFALLLPLFLFPAALFGGYVMALYGVALVGLGLLTTTGYVLAMDTFGPISDNAQGVFEMSGQAEKHPEAAKAVGRLDAAGNTTKALTKGFAIATAVVAAIALFNSYRGTAMLTEIGLKLDVPEIFLGLLIGGAAPFLFSAFAINAVGRASFELINEVRRQFREDKGIMTYESRPDYARCVALVTAAAQRELLAPGVLAIALPIAVAFGFSIGREPIEVNGHLYNLTGAQALGGFLAGAILSGQLLAVLLANAGGMWDNAKKLIEDGLYGGKGSDAHKASVVCDTLGDPFKDTAGPALNPLIKVMNLVALLLAPAIIMPLQQGVLIAVTVVSLGALIAVIALSKKGSFSDELQKATTAGAAADAHLHTATLDAPEIAPTTRVAATPAPEAPKPGKRRITVEDDENV